MVGQFHQNTHEIEMASHRMETEAGAGVPNVNHRQSTRRQESVFEHGHVGQGPRAPTLKYLGAYPFKTVSVPCDNVAQVWNLQRTFQQPPLGAWVHVRFLLMATH
jgi:hypothetical protein